VNSSQRLAEELEAADERQYAGQSAATKAQAEAVRGDFEKAMKALHRVDGDADVEIAAGRTRGYLDLAREKGLMPAQRLKALEAGEQSAASLPPWERVGVMTEIAQVHREAGRRERARGMLRKAEEITASLPASSSGMIPLVSELAKGWGRIGDQGKGRALLQQWEPFAAKAIDIDRPGAYSRLSSGRRALGDKKEADRLLLLAVASAESLRNARPRALSAVDICLTLGRDGAEPSAEIRRRLESLLANLKDPW
jgi:tetratricopeptide (TPR) repeat protein